MSIQSGTIRTWISERGFGFIQTPEGTDVFFHISNWQPADQPAVGNQVQFEAFQGQKGLAARNVELV
ncbi:MAG: cold shock domain-containing protein [Sumerlaeia bacterium]